MSDISIDGSDYSHESTHTSDLYEFDMNTLTDADADDMAEDITNINLKPRFYHQLGTRRWIQAIKDMKDTTTYIVQSNYKYKPAFKDQLLTEYVINRCHDGRFLCETREFVYWTDKEKMPLININRPDFIEITKPTNNLFCAKLTFLYYL